MHERPKRRGMLNEESSASPLVHHVLKFVLDARRLVVGQPDHAHVERRKRGGRVEVSTILGLPDQSGPAPLELGDLAHVHERPERQTVDRITFPGDTGAVVAKQCFRAVK